MCDESKKWPEGQFRSLFPDFSYVVDLNVASLAGIFVVLIDTFHPMVLPNSSFFQESGAPISLRRMIANANWSEAVEDGNINKEVINVYPSCRCL